ncbi:MAG: hypothetical protein ACPGXL_06440 [Chitinophagales bacterium]
MNNRLKSILAIGSTLLIGVLIGVLVTVLFIRERVQKGANHDRKEQMMRRGTMRILAPTDNKQKQAIEEKLEEHFNRMRSLIDEHKGERRQKTKEFRDSLAPLLNEEQMKRLDERIEKRNQTDKTKRKSSKS